MAATGIDGGIDGGNATGSGGGGTVVAAMGTSTEDDIRDLTASLIVALVPSVQSEHRFREFRYDLGDFDEHMSRNNDSIRLFSCRELLEPYQPETTNTDIEWRHVVIEVLIGYPRTFRYGNGQAGDRMRDEVMRSDLHQLESTIGLRGYGNYSGVAAMLVGESRQDVLGMRDPVAYLHFRLTFGFYRSMP